MASTPVNPITSAGEIVPTETVAETPVKGTPISRVTDPTEEVAPTPVTFIKSSAFVVIAPTPLVKPNPVNPTTSAGVIAPTADVATCPVNPTSMSAFSFTVKEPTEEVKAPGAVNVTTGDNIIVGEPIADVAETPVSPMTSAGVIAPTEEVIASGAIKFSTALSTLPQPFSPQSRVPQPGKRFIVMSPTAVVDPTPVKVILGASP